MYRERTYLIDFQSFLIASLKVIDVIHHAIDFSQVENFQSFLIASNFWPLFSPHYPTIPNTLSVFSYCFNFLMRSGGSTTSSANDLFQSFLIASAQYQPCAMSYPVSTSSNFQSFLIASPQPAPFRYSNVHKLRFIFQSFLIASLSS